MLKKALNSYYYLNELFGNTLGSYVAGGFGKIVTKAFPSKFVETAMSFNELDFGTTLSISFDCDLEEDYKQVLPLLDILDKREITAEFAIIGKFIQKYPEIHEAMLERGHEIINHTFTHPNNPIFNPNSRFEELSQEKQRREIKKCHEVCKNFLNYEPNGFRSPHFQNIYSYTILEEMGYKYSSSTKAFRTKGFGLPFKVSGIIEFPLSPSLKYPFSPLATSALRNSHYSKQEFFNIFKKTIEVGESYNSFLNFYFDPQDVRKMDFENMISLVKEKDITIETYSSISEKLDNYGNDKAEN